MLGLTPSGRRVIVTGATGGIGRALAETLLACDCAVAACDVPGVPVGDVAAVSATFDVRDPEAVRHGVADAIESLGGCDAVIANAGIVDTIHRAERFSDEEWRKDIETNLYGAFWVVQAAFEALLASGDGRIVLISSVAAEVGLPGQVAYGASKAGIVGMARTLAAEWGPRDPLQRGDARHDRHPKVRAMPAPARDGAMAQIPLGRFGEPAELAGVAAFLLSPAAAYINGTVLRVDGGFGLSMR